MKKLFTFVALCMAVTMVVTSCKNDDEDKEKRNQEMAKTLTSVAWQGNNLYQYKEMGNWIDRSTDFVVMRFDRTSETATNGTGYQLQFDGTYFNELEEMSEFTWYFSGDDLYISYKEAGWGSVHAIIDDVTLNNSYFSGYWWTNDNDRRYRFTYQKSSFKDWDKYIKN